MTTQILFAGFGGQGILFSGKFLAYAGLIEKRELSWLPSYGPEMRGGTANCSVILSDTKIGSPIVDHPDVLVAMNAPSLEKYENSVVPGGSLFVDISLVDRKVARKDVNVYYIPATKLASDNNLKGLANMILVGLLVKKTGVIDYADIEKAMTKVVPAKKAELLELNMKAIETGYNYDTEEAK